MQQQQQQQQQKQKWNQQKEQYYKYNNMGVSLNNGTPISHPKMIIFSRKRNPWLLG